MTCRGRQGRRDALFSITCLAAVAASLPVLADSVFDWEPITDHDWAVRADTTLGSRDAVYLFHKIFVDDSQVWRDRWIGEHYARLRVLTHAGRDAQANIRIPYALDVWEVQEIRARTVLPDGTVIPIDQDDIRGEDVLKSKEFKIQAKAFSFKGVTDDCIIEYIVKVKSRVQFGYDLAIQFDVPVLHGEIVWRFLGGAATGMGRMRIAKRYAPAYVFRNLEHEVEIERVPEGKHEARDVIITYENLPAFKPETHSLTGDVLLGSVVLYYAQRDYWKKTAEELDKDVEWFTKDDKRLRKTVFASVGIADSTSTDDQVAGIYDWLTHHIDNISYLDIDRKIKYNRNADHAFKRGYASRAQINKMFCGLLRRRGIDAKIAHVATRYHSPFEEHAYYWQFDTSLVLVTSGEGSRYFFSPGHLYTVASLVPWFCEGARAYVVGTEGDYEFVDVPFASSSFSRSATVATVHFDKELQLAGTLHCKLTGHAARGLRVAVAGEDDAVRDDALRERLEGLFIDSEIDSITFENLDTSEGVLALAATIEIPGTTREMGDRLILQPFAPIDVGSPFSAEERTHPIMFDYAFQDMTAMSIDLTGWEIAGLPEGIEFSNEVGSLQATFVPVGPTLSVQAQLAVNHPYWPVEDYEAVRELFAARHELANLTVVLRKPDPPTNH